MEGRQFNRRTLAILVVLTALLLLFFGVLYNLQVLHVDDYRAQSVVKIANRKTVEAARGELLDRYELSGFAGKRPCQLSGGMRQRCALIRTLASDPEILLLDEPFSALDYQTRLAVSADIWRIIRQEGKTALLVTHDIAEAVSMSDRVVVLSARPAVVKTVLDMGALRGLPPLERRSTAEFHRYFDLIWKELDVHG